MIRKQSVQDISKLNIRWLDVNEMDRERCPAEGGKERNGLVLAWSFLLPRPLIFYTIRLCSMLIREHALGNFRELLMNVSKTASMIQFLNNNQNKKGHPNENFARELDGTIHYRPADSTPKPI